MRWKANNSFELTSIYSVTNVYLKKLMIIRKRNQIHETSVQAISLTPRESLIILISIPNELFITYLLLNLYVKFFLLKMILLYAKIAEWITFGISQLSQWLGEKNVRSIDLLFDNLYKIKARKVQDFKECVT